MDGLPSREVARRGMSRTFQHVKLVPDVTVLENVALGTRPAHAQRCGGGHAAAGPRRGGARAWHEAARQIERIGLGAADARRRGQPRFLGSQRLVEIARALASDPALLLLDEPAAGLRHHEKQALAGVLRQLRAQGLSLLAEHDMDFVMNLTDRVVVMVSEFGTLLTSRHPRRGPGQRRGARRPTWAPSIREDLPR
ncbi:MAG UNVERIFIED_CONTAM: ATP-binding cassette domain-containing protein [Microcystis novacekii LVE1205-3]